MNVHLITFATMHDDCQSIGSDLSFQVSKFCKKFGIGFESVHVVTPKLMKEKGLEVQEIFIDQVDWVESQQKDRDFRWNRNWAELNFLLWKPFVIREALAGNLFDVCEGDIIFYHDIDFIKYRDYLKNRIFWSEFVLAALHDNSVMLIDDGLSSITKDVKREVRLRYLNHIKSHENLHHIWAGALAVKVDSSGRKFADRWFELTNDIENRSQVTDHQDEAGFYWHSQEQACLSVLYHLGEFGNVTNLIRLDKSRVFPSYSSLSLGLVLRTFKNLVFSYQRKSDV